MTKLYHILILGILTTHCSFGQIQALFPQDRSVTANEIIYYPFSEGLQMVEIDYYSGYRFHQMQYSRMGYVPPYPEKKVNEYFFRDTLGQMVKSFNASCDIDSLSKMLVPVPFVNRDNHRTTIWDDYYHIGKLSGYYDVYEGSRQGIIDSLGNIVIPIVYQEIFHKPNCFLVNKNGQWSFVTAENYELHPDFFDDYHERHPLIYFSNKNRLAFVYNYQTDLKHNLSNFDDVRMLAQGVEGMAWVKKGGKWGLWNYVDNTEVLPFDYDSGNYFSYFFATEYQTMVIVSQNGKFGLISLHNTEPRVVLMCEYDKIYPSKTKSGPPYSYKEGYITVEKNGEELEYELNKLPLRK